MLSISELSFPKVLPGAYNLSEPCGLHPHDHRHYSLETYVLRKNPSHPYPLCTSFRHRHGCGAYCEELGDYTTGHCEDWLVAVGRIPHCNSYFSSIKYQGFSVCACSPPKQFLICWLTSSDVSVDALRARSMVAAVSAGTVAVVEELVIPPLLIGHRLFQPRLRNVRTRVWLRSNPYHFPSAKSYVRAAWLR